MIFRSPTRTLVWNVAPTDPLEFLLEFGEIEAALADRLCPETDDLTPKTRKIMAAAARAVVSGTSLPEVALPIGPLETSVPEGYAYYGLDPYTYVESAKRFYREQRPNEVVCIGLRSIGTSLSSLVGAALEQCGSRVQTYTVRPHGHPYDREVRLAPQLESALQSQVHAWFAVVDEGPGLSGSSFASVARKLSQLSVPDHRIVLFPSWEADGNGFVSQSARDQWQRHAKYTTDFTPPPGWQDISAGRWRSLVFEQESDYPKVHPQHEARKYLDGPDLLKFEGLGSFGRKRFERAQELAEAGFVPPALELSNGFMRSRFIAGRPVAAPCRDPELLETMARYIAFRAGADPSNTVPDARMYPHEWLATSQGYLKTDAIDHGDNHFLPGPTDIAWDLAGAIAEFQFEPNAAEYLIESYQRHSGDKDVRERLPEASVRYAQFRNEYRSMYDC